MTTFTRAELERILDVRRLNGNIESQGATPWLEFKFRITPEMLALVMDGYFLSANGTRSRLVAIQIDGDLATPILEAC